MWNQIVDVLLGPDPAKLPPARGQIENHIARLREQLKGIQVELDSANDNVNKSIDQLRHLTGPVNKNCSEAQILQANLVARTTIQNRYKTVNDELTKMHQSLLAMDTTRNERNTERVQSKTKPPPKTEYEAAAEIVDQQEQHILQLSARRQRLRMQNAFEDQDSNSMQHHPEMEAILASLALLPPTPPVQSFPIPAGDLPPPPEDVTAAARLRANA